jgi:thiamine-phosphate pyrophosphorylase
VAGTSDKRHRLRGVYLLTREDGDDARLCAGVAAALAGGVGIVQYRDKSGDDARRRAQAGALRALTRARGALLIINDDAALAAAVGADGVHLGRDDGDVGAARAVLGADAIIGVSCYDESARAAAAAAAGADYLAFGAFYASTTKPDARHAGLDVLAAAAAFGLPRVAIGGINAHNARPLIDAGADAIAVLGAIWDAPDREAAARDLSQLFVSRS